MNKNSFTVPSMPVVTAPQKLTSNRFELTRRDFVFVALFCVASFLLSDLGIFGGFRLGFTLSFLLFFSVMTTYLWHKGSRIRLFPLLCGVLSILNTLSFSITSNGTVRFFGFEANLLLALVWFISLSVPQFEKGDMGLLKTVFYPVFLWAIPHLPKTMVSLFSADMKRRKTTGMVFIGIGLALPVLLVIIPLLMSSDAAFSGMVGRLFNNVFATAMKLFLAALIAAFALSYAISCRKETMTISKEKEFCGIDNAILISFLSVLSVCYLAYLFSQLAYFFSAFQGFLPKDFVFTPAEYARRGFFEMCVIAVINFVLLYAVLQLSRKQNGKMPVLLRVLTTFIALFTLLIIATALSKMLLYIQSFGMTELRITTSCFMVFWVVVFVGLLLRIHLPNIPVLKIACVTAGTVLVLLGVGNVNHVVAAYNYHAYQTKALQTIDLQELYELGDEGVPYLLRLVDDAEVGMIAKGKLIECMQNETYYTLDWKDVEGANIPFIGAKKESGFAAFTFARQEAYRAIDAFVEDYGVDVVEAIMNADYYSETGEELYEY